MLKDAIHALQATEPDAAQVTDSARRVANRLGLDSVSDLKIDAIESCDDVQHSLAAYRAGTLSPSRSLLIEAHMRDCSMCRRQLHSASGASVLDWSRPTRWRGFAWHPRAFGWSLASAFALMVFSYFIYTAYWQVPPGVRAEVQSIDGSAYLISAAGDRPLTAGSQLAEGDRLRTSGGAHAVLRLSDGSTVEVNERSVLGVGARGHNMTVSVDDGAVIVQAAHRTSGHLYVKTPDCRVAVTGTVFSVNAGIKGSRVAVLQGSVHVLHAGVDSLMQAGDQVATSDNLSPEPMEQQIAWSHDRDKFLPLLAQFSLLQHRIEQIPLPELRYASDLLTRVPSDTVLYISIPNLGDFLSEANQIFHDQLQKSPALKQWWDSGHAQNTADLDSLVEKLHQMSQYLGDEIVIVSVNPSKNQGFAVVADVKRGGLDDFLKNEFPMSNSKPGLTVLDESSLAAIPASDKTNAGGYALMREHEVIFSNSIATLKQVNAQFNTGASGFATGAFGEQIASAYTRGAGVILAADIHRMIDSNVKQIHAGARGAEFAEASGIGGVRYLIAEHRESNGRPENRVNLQFAGTRQGVASWLAAPAPIGSLEFVSPNAAIAVAALSKDPKAIADDLIAMAAKDKGEHGEELSDVEAELQINFRDDLAANLGGDFLLALDGPVLPTPSWKAVIEVRDPGRLEQTIEHLMEAIRSHSQGKQAHSITIESSEANGQKFYSVNDLTSGVTVAQYTFADGYMIVAPNRALIMEALHTYATGDSLAHSAAFKALLPKDDNENYSAVAYQNLSPVMTPLLSQFSGESADAIRQLASDARPTAICVRGEDTRIEAASDSHLFGFDLLTLGSLIHSGNRPAPANVIN
jgi:hypothetical protein